MSTNLQRLDQLAKPDNFDDQKTAEEIENSEWASNDFGNFLEHVLSQLNKILNGRLQGNWYDEAEPRIVRSYEQAKEYIAEDEILFVGENKQLIMYHRIINDGAVICDGLGVVIENG